MTIPLQRAGRCCGYAATAGACGPSIWSCCPVHSGFTEASANGAGRVRQLRLAADLLHRGRLVEPAWLRCQLLDLADLVALHGLDDDTPGGG